MRLRYREVSASPCLEPIVHPKLVHAATLDFPQSDVGGVQNAQVKVLVTIDSNGKAIGADIYQSSRRKEIDDKAVRAAKASTFTPLLKECKPVSGGHFLLNWLLTDKDR